MQPDRSQIRQVLFNLKISSQFMIHQVLILSHAQSYHSIKVSVTDNMLVIVQLFLFLKHHESSVEPGSFFWSDLTADIKLNNMLPL